MLKTALFGSFILMQIVGTEDVVNAQTPQVLEAAAPGYPQLPSGGRESGEVQVEVAIGTSGEVVNAKAVSGPERLRAAAEGAARKWRFKVQDKPTEKWLVTFGFNLRPGLGEPPAVPSVFKAPDRIDVFAAERKIVTISDPPLEDVDKVRKKQKKQ
ncbi:MAG: TonB family protein [Acidobacteriota bacterium]